MIRKTALALTADVVLVVVFCLIGRHNHHEAALSGLARTAWPFLCGLALGWAVIRATTIRARSPFPNPTALWPTGVAAWLGTLLGGMALRVLSGQGTALSFIVVATTALGIFLLGWRAAVRVIPNR